MTAKIEEITLKNIETWREITLQDAAYFKPARQSLVLKLLDAAERSIVLADKVCECGRALEMAKQYMLKLEAENKMLREGLKFYADREYIDPVTAFDTHENDSDCGKKAREIRFVGGKPHIVADNGELVAVEWR